MNIKITYPPQEKPRLNRQQLMAWCRWLFLYGGFLCAVVNLSVGGRAWSLVVIWSMWLLWTQLVSPDLVEYNRISQTIKLIVHSCVLLILIDRILAPGFAVGVVPIVCFSALALVAALFFTDFEKQRQNMLPMLFFCALCLLGSILGLSVLRTAERWPLTVMGAVALCLLVGCMAKLREDFLQELKKRFCIK